MRPRILVAISLILVAGVLIGSFSTLHVLEQTSRGRVDVAYEAVDALRIELHGALSALQDARQREALIVDSFNELVTQTLSELEQGQRLRLSGVIERFLSVSASAPEGSAIRATADEVREIYFGG